MGRALGTHNVEKTLPSSREEMLMATWRNTQFPEDASEPLSPLPYIFIGFLNLVLCGSSAFRDAIVSSTSVLGFPFPKLSPLCPTWTPMGAPRESMEQTPPSRTARAGGPWPWQSQHFRVHARHPLPSYPRPSGTHMPTFNRDVWSHLKRATPTPKWY